MGVAEVAAERGLGRELGGAHGDAMGLDVVGVAVAAVRVVGDQDLGADLADHLDEMGCGLVQVGGPEGAGPVVLLGAHHPGVAEASGAAEEAVVGDPELLHGGGELADAVRAEDVLAVRGEVRENVRDDLALLAEGAGHQGDVGTVGRVLGHGGAIVDRLVVGVRVHEEQTPVGQFRHAPQPRTS